MTGIVKWIASHKNHVPPFDRRYPHRCVCVEDFRLLYNIGIDFTVRSDDINLVPDFDLFQDQKVISIPMTVHDAK